MKKITALVCLAVVCAGLVFGQTLVLQARLELARFYNECDKALTRFYYATTF